MLILYFSAYSGDGVYLYSTLDDPEESRSLSELPKEGSAMSSSLTNYIEETETEEPEIEEETEYEMADDGLPGLPTVYPQRKFVGARNVETVKDGMYCTDSYPTDSLIYNKI